MSESRRKKYFDLTPAEAERAIYMDFEGAMNDPPSLLGVAYTETNGSEPILAQYVIDEALHPAGRVKPQCKCTVLDQALFNIMELSKCEYRKIVV